LVDFGSEVLVKIKLDAEFPSSWGSVPSRIALDPFTLTLAIARGQLRKAASEWDEEIPIYLDGLA
jgi:hypothetical protein